MKPIEKRMLILAAITLLSLVFLIFSFAFNSLESQSASDFKDKLNKLKKKETDLKAREQTSQEWINIDKSYQDFKKQYLLEFANLSKFRTMLISQMRKNMLDHSNLNVRYQAPSQNDIGRVKYEFSLNGTYVNIKRFIHELEGYKELVLLKQVSMNKTRRGIQAKFTLEVYYAK